MERWARAKYQPVLPLGENGTRITASKKHINLSKDAAKEGMVLLKNEGILPVDTSQKIAFIGPYTNNNEINYIVNNTSLEEDN